jgi:hypothetical protein
MLIIQLNTCYCGKPLKNSNLVLKSKNKVKLGYGGPESGKNLNANFLIVSGSYQWFEKRGVTLNFIR